ncbi:MULTISPECIES: CheR family methyltransferase [Paracoccus]|jgi:chemotaxis protein methyltransferase CheR|uniref:Protein-glutamate O-methyltransferase CheR n=2 Tax=Paracoccus TaxID=265 RepID=A0A5C4R851_9RHOB|nr:MULTISPECIES: CheR family methyltransferase [Paracoccus]KIX18855.1 chemotaxis protein CheR [Paracoccus sp. 228]KJZ32565.1 chemotaxis protein CheR [Paracoccus sp. S4493]MCO6363422.1 protein-glutamate O-methyltransferase CheR [Paracoccus sp. 08]QXI63629.1 Chemotaxis protein methyltransferase [Paracoccus marcusii]TNH40092.1 protein-glutamate O-methyltransferase CheR [Paracoccus haeundaensis]
MSVDPVPLRAADAIELDLFLEALNRRHHYDFRSYSRASLARRAELARERLGCATLSEVQGRLLHDPAVLPDIIDAMTVQVSELFRDPAYYLALRREVIPHLRTFPSLKVWVAGCADGEELYSLAILFREEGLFDRTMFYATEINRRALARAEAGIYDIDRLPVFSQNYQRAGGLGSLSDYYTAAYGRAAFDRGLRSRTVFTEHNLATDQVFSEVQLVSCRNVLIYFDGTLQDRAVGLFAEALARGGFLGLGSHETLRFSTHAASFAAFAEPDRIWRRNADQETVHAR